MSRDHFATSELKAIYYIGAGASAEALPVVKNWFESFEMLASYLKNDETIDPSFSAFKNNLVSKLQWLSAKSVEFKTVDTFAKYLYLKGAPDLNELKKTLNEFFLIQQLYFKKRDKRPLIFLTTVMQNGGVFPTNINIVSWNYDFQMQFAGEEFRNEKIHIGASGVTTYKAPLISYYPKLGYRQDNEGAQLIQLNGIAGFYSTENFTTNLFQRNTPENLNQLFDLLIKTESQNLLSFAWEQQYNGCYSKHVYRAAELMSEADIVVVVGYSFPYFNREIDNLIFTKFKESDRKKIIYFQDPTLNGQFLKTQFNLNATIEIKHVEQVNNYYVPIEL